MSLIDIADRNTGVDGLEPAFALRQLLNQEAEIQQIKAKIANA